MTPRGAPALLAVLAGLPLAAAVPAEVHLGLPGADPAAALSVTWREDAPRSEPAIVVLEGPADASRGVPAVLVPGPGPGAVYEAVLDGLSPATDYAYRIDAREFGFRTLPASLAPDRPLRILALGDMGTSEEAEGVAGLVADLAPDLVLHAGDIAYAEGVPGEWAKWFRMVEPVAAAVPWITAIGNHETYTVAPAGPSPVEIATYRQRFALPGNELWYSFDLAGGAVHVVALDTFTDPERAARDAPPEEVAWLDSDLRDHANATWTIAFLHEPAWSSNADHGPAVRVQRAFVPLFEEHGVDLVVAGHDHDYERTFPLLGKEVASANASEYVEGEGVVHVVTGGAGADLYVQFQYPQPDWSATRRAFHHVLLIEVTPDTIDARTVALRPEDPYEDAFRIARADATAPAAGGDAVVTPALPAILAIGAAAVGAIARRARRGGGPSR